MIRTQVYFPREELNQLREIAWAQKTTVSEVLRAAAREKIESSKPKGKVVKKKQNAGTFLLSLAREAERLHIRGPKDLSKNMDTYLYGDM